MANNEQNDKELNDYLNGNSDVSKAYRASNKTEPAVHLNEKILSAAKESVENTAHKSKPKFHKAPWVKPVSIAAMITLSVSLVVTMQQETGQPLISEPEVEMFDSASVVEDLAMPETILSSDDASVMNEVELKQNKDGRVDVPAPAALGAAADRYRAEEKAEAPKARMKEAPAKKMLLKEKSQRQNEALEERVFADEQIMESAPTGVEFDDVMDMEQARELNLQKDELLKIKALWEEGGHEEAKELFKQFIKDNPDFSEDAIKKFLGEELFVLIKSK